MWPTLLSDFICHSSFKIHLVAFWGPDKFRKIGISMWMWRRVESIDMQALPCTLHSPPPFEFLPLDLPSTKKSRCNLEKEFKWLQGRVTGYRGWGIDTRGFNWEERYGRDMIICHQFCSDSCEAREYKWTNVSVQCSSWFDSYEVGVMCKQSRLLASCKSFDIRSCDYERRSCSVLFLIRHPEVGTLTLACLNNMIHVFWCFVKWMLRSWEIDLQVSMCQCIVAADLVHMKWM